MSMSLALFLCDQTESIRLREPTWPRLTTIVYSNLLSLYKQADSLFSQLCEVSASCTEPSAFSYDIVDALNSQGVLATGDKADSQPCVYKTNRTVQIADSSVGNDFHSL